MGKIKPTKMVALNVRVTKKQAAQMDSLITDDYYRSRSNFVREAIGYLLKKNDHNQSSYSSAQEGS